MPVLSIGRENKVKSIDYIKKTVGFNTLVLSSLYIVHDFVFLSFVASAVTLSATFGYRLASVDTELADVEAVEKKIELTKRYNFENNKIERIASWSELKNSYIEQEKDIEKNTENSSIIIEKLLKHYENSKQKDKQSGVDFIGYTMWFFQENNISSPVQQLNNLFSTCKFCQLSTNEQLSVNTLPDSGYNDIYNDGGNQVKHILETIQTQEKNGSTQEGKINEFCSEVADYKLNNEFNIESIQNVLRGCGILGDSEGENKQDLMLGVIIQASKNDPLTFVEYLDNPPQAVEDYLR